ncbi:ATP-binding protein [Siphonobacter sp. SORGH_AS_0500]|uniref:ABC transporter ATP-binding protein n=1 Tax=Siphonobacter sp. SORGH_AS_0500 TaxID=1864824 RepID=UPI000CA8B623|nr:ABC transporter ATP-binding protein [Siphonobacter sp. SORGH_AS_0500]PKK37172.1 ATP-binding protein [Siphonobacter sp. SORGH_AS_0500]
MSANLLLHTRHLSIGYGNHRVAGPLSVQLKAGQLVCLLGPNGAGKSTLMRTLSGLQNALEGDVYLGDKRLPHIPPTELAKKLSLVLTERVEAGHLTVGELVALGRTPYTNWLGSLTSADQERVQWALALTGTQSFINRRLPQLSDGERQKVMLARALAQDTDLILLDEPTAHLDLPSRVELMRLLHELARQTRKAILLSTHELDLALQAADELWLLGAKGEFEHGVPEDLVLNGSFERTFAASGFAFDRTTGTFQMYPAPTGPALGLQGNSAAYFWTRRALSREGYQIQASARHSVQVTDEGWFIDEQTFVTSIHDLLQELSNRYSYRTDNEDLHKKRR